MAEEKKETVRNPVRRGPGHGPVGMGEKPKDFKGTAMKLIRYMKNHISAIIVVVLFTIGSTVFVILGPKILGQATTAVFHGLEDLCVYCATAFGANRPVTTIPPKVETSSFSKSTPKKSSTLCMAARPETL